MRFILTPIGSAGDVRPFAAVGRALAARGHSVALLAAEPFAPLAREAGLRFVSTWPAADYEREALDPALWDPAHGMKLVMRIVAGQLQTLWDAVESVAEPGPAVVVAHALAFAARAFAEKHAIPSATLQVSPSVFRSEYEQPAIAGLPDLNRLPRFLLRPLWRMLDAVAIDPLIAPSLNRFRQQHGLPALHRVFDRHIHSPQLVLGLFPEWFARPQRDWPAQTKLTGFPNGQDDDRVDPELDAWLSAGDPPIVITPGTGNRQASFFLSAAIAAADRIGRRALIATTWNEQVQADLPPSFRRVDFAPFGAMLHRCAAIVHHGGIGTCAQGLRSGVPQLIMPMAFDQPDNAARLRSLGVGALIPPKKFKAVTVAAQLQHLLSDPHVAARCAHWRAASEREDGVAMACNELERFAGDLRRN